MKKLEKITEEIRMPKSIPEEDYYYPVKWVYRWVEFGRKMRSYSTAFKELVNNTYFPN